MDGWEGNEWMGWKYSHTLHWNGTQKYCSTICTGFLLVPHDDIGGGGNWTAWCRIGAHSVLDVLLFASLLMLELTRH